jgi:flagellar biosynthesis/type III secretory pathway protein FliH
MVDLFRGRSNLDTLKRVFARLQQSAAAKGRDVDDLILSLQQEKPMLDLIQQNFERVLDKLHAQGKEEGKLEGKLEGIREGIREGKLEGKLEGKREGKLEGEAVARAAQRRALVKYLNRCFGAEHGWEPLVGLVEDLDALQSLFDQADEAKTPQEMRDKIEAAALR